MKSLIALAAGAAIVAIALPAAAQTITLAPVTYEGSVGYTGIQSNGKELGAINLRASAFFGKYLGVEGEGAFGVNDETTNFGPASVKTHLNDEYAGYGVVRYPVLPNATVFARVGYGHNDFRLTASNGLASTGVTLGEDSLNYGAGAQYFFTPKDGVRVDYTRVDFRDRGFQDADTWSVSYVRRF